MRMRVCSFTTLCFCVYKKKDLIINKAVVNFIYLKTASQSIKLTQTLQNKWLDFYTVFVSDFVIKLPVYANDKS